MKHSFFRKSQVYVTPVTRLVAIDAVSMVCGSGNVMLNPGGSGNSSWDSEEGHEGGSVIFGDEPSSSSAKWSVWEEEE